MIYLELFFAFCEIGALSFGGGYGMLSLIREKALICGWLNESEFLNLVAISEATPGPIAINMATFVGSAQGGMLGALCATLGAILPSFLLVLVIVACINQLLKYAGVTAFLRGVRPAVIGLIVATAGLMLINSLIGVRALGDTVTPDYIGIAIFAALALIAFAYKKIRGKSISPILLIVISAVIGVAEGLLQTGL